MFAFASGSPPDAVGRSGAESEVGGLWRRVDALEGRCRSWGASSPPWSGSAPVLQAQAEKLPLEDNTQLAREAGASVIGTGRAADRQKALDFGAAEFVALEDDALEDVGGVDLVFDVIGGDIQKRSAGVIRAGGHW